MGFLDWMNQMAQIAVEQMQSAAMEAITQFQMLDDLSRMVQQATDLHSFLMDQDNLQMHQDMIDTHQDFMDHDFMDHSGGMGMF